ncbi:MAG: hypothetical protein ABH883_07630 [Candidatus Omnitrophota bacterium]
MENTQYEKYLLSGELQFEARCVRCGECCGAMDDPCANLVKLQDNTYYCRDYANRLGPQKTLSGVPFNCVSIREHIGKGSLRQNCAYRRRVRV